MSASKDWKPSGKPVTTKTLAEYAAEAAAADQVGLSCPKCGCNDLRAYYRTAYPGFYRRVRICRACSWRVETIEQITGDAKQH